MKTATTAALALLFSATMAVGAFAQTADMIMPALYNAAGTQVNTTNASLPAGDYFLQSGTRVSYYGNGTYYDPTTQLYGGSVADPSGQAGVALNYSSSNVAVSSPGVPNTGFGGDAATTWMTLGLSGLIAVAGLAYLATRVVVR